MDKNLFQNDYITGNSKIGFEFKGQFTDDENVLLEQLKNVLNRKVTFSNIEYKLLEPTDNTAVMIQDGNFYEIKTPMYSYFEALFIMPKILDFLKGLKEIKNSYLYFRIGFDPDFCDISQLNVMKFVLEFKEDYILKNIKNLTTDGSIEKLTDIKPRNLESCTEYVQKELDSLKYEENEVYGLNFNTVTLGYITFKYAEEIDYKKKWEELIKCINHTIITLYNASTYTQYTEEEQKQLDEMEENYKDIFDSFSCYELFKEKYQKIKLTSDLDNDTSIINVIYPSIKDKLFDIVIRNNIKTAKINYDTDISKLQLKDLELKKCYHLSGVDIVDSELENCSIKDCDIYDTKINKSTINHCNLFGFANCKDSKFKDSFISRNIKLTDCHVFGALGKMGGTMKGGSLRNTTILTSMAEIDDNVEKNNVNEIQ